MEMACFRFLSTDTQGQTPAACHGAVQKLDACYEQFGTAQGSCTEVRERQRQRERDPHLFCHILSVRQFVA